MQQFPRSARVLVGVDRSVFCGRSGAIHAFHRRKNGASGGWTADYLPLLSPSGAGRANYFTRPPEFTSSPRYLDEFVDADLLDVEQDSNILQPPRWTPPPIRQSIVEEVRLKNSLPSNSPIFEALQHSLKVSIFWSFGKKFVVPF